MPEEFFDIYDADGKRTGDIVSRTDVHKKGLWHKSVHVWIICEGKILLQKRSLSKESYPGLWDISVAGHISAGEDVLETAIREVSEEIGIEFSQGEFTYLFTALNESVLNEGLFVDKEINEVFLVECSPLDEDIVDKFVPNEEVEALRWIDIAELKSMVNAGSASLVPHLKEYKQLFSFLKV